MLTRIFLLLSCLSFSYIAGLPRDADYIVYPSACQKSICKLVDITIDAEGSLYLADLANCRVLKLRHRSPGTFEEGGWLGRNCTDLQGVASPSQFWPTSSRIDRHGSLWIADRSRILRFAPASLLAPQATTDAAACYGVQNCSTMLDEMSWRSNTFVDSSDLLWNTYGSGWNIQVGAVSGLEMYGNIYVAGQPEPKWSWVQPDTNVKLPKFHSSGEAADIFFGTGPSEPLFLIDVGNSRVVRWPRRDDVLDKFTPDYIWGQPDWRSIPPGVIPEIWNEIEVPLIPELQPNPNTDWGFANPTGLAVDDFGNLYVSDIANQRVMMWRSAAFVPWTRWGTNDSTGVTADFMWGQPDWHSGYPDPTTGGIINIVPGDCVVDDDINKLRSKLYAPYRIVIDKKERILWVLDNCRVMGYKQYVSRLTQPYMLQMVFAGHSPTVTYLPTDKHGHIIPWKYDLNWHPTEIIEKSADGGLVDRHLLDPFLFCASAEEDQEHGQTYKFSANIETSKYQTFKVSFDYLLSKHKRKLENAGVKQTAGPDSVLQDIRIHEYSCPQDHSLELVFRVRSLSAVIPEQSSHLYPGITTLSAFSEDGKMLVSVNLNEFVIVKDKARPWYQYGLSNDMLSIKLPCSEYIHYQLSTSVILL